MNDITAPAPILTQNQAIEQAENDSNIQQNQSVVENPFLKEAKERLGEIERAPIVNVSPTIRILDEDTSKGRPDTPSPKPEWFYSDNVGGQGEKPEWFNDKTFETVEAQAKAQNEARKMLGGFTGAPKDGYELDIGENYKDITFDEKDPLLNNFANFAKEKNMSQEMFNEVLSLWVDNQKNEELQTTKAKEEYWQEELKKLGPTGAEDLKILNQWARNVLPKELYNDFEKGTKSSGMVKIFQTLQDKIIPTKITHVSHGIGLNRSQLRALMADPLYKTDPDYRRTVDQQYEAFNGINKIYD